MKQEDFLINIGLTSTEAEIYSKLLGFQNLSVNELVKETNIRRTTIYHALQTLEQKGLVSKHLKSGRLAYSSTHPKSIKKFLDNQIDSINSKKEELEMIIPKLLNATKLVSQSIRVSQSEGIEGIKNIIEEALYCHSRKWEIIAPSKNFFSEFDTRFARYFIQTRIDNGITARSLWESVPGRRILTEQEIAKRNPRYLPEIMHGKFKSVILLFDNKIALVTSLKEKTAILIESEELHNTMQVVFEGLWANAKPYKIS